MLYLVIKITNYQYMKITCFICSLSSGGAEHQLTELTRQLHDRGYDITITTFADVADHYACADGISLIRLAENRSLL